MKGQNSKQKETVPLCNIASNISLASCTQQALQRGPASESEVDVSRAAFFSSVVQTSIFSVCHATVFPSALPHTLFWSGCNASIHESTGSKFQVFQNLFAFQHTAVLQTMLHHPLSTTLKLLVSKEGSAPRLNPKLGSARNAMTAPATHSRMARRSGAR